jgi:hypothetical protein
MKRVIPSSQTAAVDHFAVETDGVFDGNMF